MRVLSPDIGVDRNAITSNLNVEGTQVNQKQLKRNFLFVIEANLSFKLHVTAGETAECDI